MRDPEDYHEGVAGAAGVSVLGRRLLQRGNGGGTLSIAATGPDGDRKHQLLQGTSEHAIVRVPHERFRMCLLSKRKELVHFGSTVGSALLVTSSAC